MSTRPTSSNRLSIPRPSPSNLLEEKNDVDMEKVRKVVNEFGDNHNVSNEDDKVTDNIDEIRYRTQSLAKI
jgi:hypothetical protein